MPTVMVVEDEEALALLLKYNLQKLKNLLTVMNKSLNLF